LCRSSLSRQIRGGEICESDARRVANGEWRIPQRPADAVGSSKAECAVVALVIPELQSHGLFRAEYESTTLRENMELERPKSRYVSN
jgi:hypothetical protein